MYFVPYRQDLGVGQQRHATVEREFSLALGAKPGFELNSTEDLRALKIS